MFETEPRLGRSLNDNELEAFLKENFSLVAYMGTYGTQFVYPLGMASF